MTQVTDINIDGGTLTLKRIFGAPVDKVYAAWADPDKLKQWFAPNVRWAPPTVDINNVVGGTRNLTMNHSDGDKMRLFGKYLDVVPNERLKFTLSFLDSPGADYELVMTLEFRATANGTELTLIQQGRPDPEMTKSTSEGWGGCFDMLALYLDGNAPFGE